MRTQSYGNRDHGLRLGSGSYVNALSYPDTFMNVRQCINVDFISMDNVLTLDINAIILTGLAPTWMICCCRPLHLFSEYFSFRQTVNAVFFVETNLRNLEGGCTKTINKLQVTAKGPLNRCIFSGWKEVFPRWFPLISLQYALLQFPSGKLAAVSALSGNYASHLKRGGVRGRHGHIFLMQQIKRFHSHR